MLKAGELRERFEFQERERLADPGDEHGVAEGDWKHRFQCYARLIPLRRGETVLAARLQGVQPHVLTIRAHAQARAVRTDWRCVDMRTQVSYNIRTVEASPDNASIDMLIEAGPADG